MKMSVDSVVEVEAEKWKVKPVEASGNVIKQCESCTDASCLLRCQRCNICLHRFLCNCPDSLIQSTICKHVHLLQTVLTMQGNKENHEITDIPLNFDADRTEYVKEEVEALTVICQSNKREMMSGK